MMKQRALWRHYFNNMDSLLSIDYCDSIKKQYSNIIIIIKILSGQSICFSIIQCVFWLNPTEANNNNITNNTKSIE